jgi:hypothetical protein
MIAKSILLVCLLGTTAGCAFKGDVHRMSVDFNGAVANTANELTLLNVIRAKDYQPLHFSSFSLVRGSISFQGSAGTDASLKGRQTTTKTDAARNIATDVVNGVDTFTPKFGAQLTSGPSFDIAVYDTQEFYQGILTSLPPSTVAHYLYQGWRSDLISYLLVQRVNYRARETFTVGSGANAITYRKGDIVRSIETAPHGDGAEEFKELVKCFELQPVAEQPPAVPLAPASRLAEVKISELALLDGKSLDLEGTMSANPANDTAVMVRRVRPGRDSLRLFLIDKSQAGECGGRTGFALATNSDGTPSLQASNDSHDDVVTVNRGYYSLTGGTSAEERLKRVEDLQNAKTRVPVNVEFVLRSVEGVFAFLGDYLRSDDDQRNVYQVEGQRIFDVREGNPPARVFASAALGGRRYFITPDESNRQSMQVIALLQQLVNLQKKSTDKPATQAVRVLE